MSEYLNFLKLTIKKLDLYKIFHGKQSFDQKIKNVRV